jgi:hypothetical protein
MGGNVMKKIAVIVLLLVSSYACTVQKEIEKAETNSFSPVLSSPVQPSDKAVIPIKKDIKPLFGTLLKDVSLSQSSFNPSRDQKIVLSYWLSKSALVLVNVYDPDHGLINTIAGEKFMEAGQQSIAWDGKDMEGQIVPDEAYFFTLIAEDKSGNMEIYDPTTFSGGRENDIIEAGIDPRHHTIDYSLPEMGRVMIRMGIRGGPLMNQLVDWKPRVKGAITEYWNGRDVDDLVDIYNHPKFKMIITYFSLPKTSVITFGNKSNNFLDYKRSIAGKRPIKPKRESSVVGVSRHYKIPRTEDYTPRITATFVNVQGKDKYGLPVLNKKTMVTVALDEKDKAIFQKHQFEICFFLDDKFYAEDETGFTPFNWVWDLSNIEEGEHLLTINISSFQDQIGLLSKKVKVVK